MTKIDPYPFMKSEGELEQQQQPPSYAEDRDCIALDRQSQLSPYRDIESLNSSSTTASTETNDKVLTPTSSETESSKAEAYSDNEHITESKWIKSGCSKGGCNRPSIGCRGIDRKRRVGRLMSSIVLFALGIYFLTLSAKLLPSITHRHRRIGCHKPDKTLSDDRQVVHIKTNDESITGVFDLDYELILETRSGDIDVDIRPLDKEYQAHFTAKTESGRINVHFPANGKVPDRGYDTRLKSFSGSIGGTYLASPHLFISNIAGNIDVDAWVLDGNRSSGIRTHCVSGMTKVIVLPSGDGPLLDLEGDHLSSSGAMRLQYPDTWEGTAKATSKSGDLRIITREDKKTGLGGGTIEVSQGNSSGMIIGTSESGTVQIEAR